jgi:hypothetical protein
MALLSSAARQTLNSWSFIQEFNKNESAYLDLVHIIAKDFLGTCQRYNIQVPVNPEEDFADKHLVGKTIYWLLADNAFKYFRQALKRGRRKYIVILVTTGSGQK